MRRFSSAGGAGSSSPSRQRLTASRKIQGLPSMPLAIMTPSQPVSSIMRTASAAAKTSPLPMTGMDTAFFTCAMMSQSALPV